MEDASDEPPHKCFTTQCAGRQAYVKRFTTPQRDEAISGQIWIVTSELISLAL